MYSVPRAIRRATAASRTTAASVRYNGTRQYSSTMHDNDPELLEREKHRNLANTQSKTSAPFELAPGWNECLASASEAHVKADRYEGTPADLQRVTVDYVHSRHSPDDRVSPRESSYERDEVSGPLSTKGKPDGFRRTVRDAQAEERDEISGPLGTAAGVEDSHAESMNTGRRVRRTFREETTEETVASTSKQNVKADRGEV